MARRSGGPSLPLLGRQPDRTHLAEDDREAVRWYRKAAEQGHAPAYVQLGFMHQDGEGVSKDFVQSHAWFNLAAVRGMEWAEEARTALEARMTQAQIAEAQQLSRQLAD